MQYRRYEGEWKYKIIKGNLRILLRIFFETFDFLGGEKHYPEVLRCVSNSHESDAALNGEQYFFYEIFIFFVVMFVAKKC